MTFFKTRIIYSICIFSIFSCTQKNDLKKHQEIWLKGSESEKLISIEKQFRGFDVTMVETSYRYQELFWAGQNKNWENAIYQLDKIKLTLENGIQRRPKRSNSTKYFLKSVDEFKNELKQKNHNSFNLQFIKLTNSCNNCHSIEKVSFFKVKIPIENHSILK